MTKEKLKKTYKEESEELKNYFDYKIPKLKLMMVREPNESAESSRIYGPEEFEEFSEPLKHASEEYFIAVHLDNKNNVIGYHEVSHGTLSSSLVHPREVFKAALLSNASSIIVAHNHPGGSLEPSEEDIEVTENLVEAGKLMGVKVFDHVIVSYKGVESIRTLHQEIFDE